MFNLSRSREESRGGSIRLHVESWKILCACSRVKNFINRIMDEREQTRENYSSRAKPETNDFLESASANLLSCLVNASLLSSLLHTDMTVWVMAQNRSLNIIGRTALRAILKIYCTLLQW